MQGLHRQTLSPCEEPREHPVPSGNTREGVIGYTTPGGGRGAQSQPDCRGRITGLAFHFSPSILELARQPHSPLVGLMDAAGLLLLSYSASGILAYIFKVFTGKLALSHSVAPSSSIIHGSAGSSPLLNHPDSELSGSANCNLPT